MNDRRWRCSAETVRQSNAVGWKLAIFGRDHNEILRTGRPTASPSHCTFARSAFTYRPARSVVLRAVHWLVIAQCLRMSDSILAQCKSRNPQGGLAGNSSIRQRRYSLIRPRSFLLSLRWALNLACTPLSQAATCHDMRRLVVLLLYVHAGFAW